jgi:5-formyltetrahydrofolate cyclo-ligase
MKKKELREKYKILRQELDQNSIDQLSRACFNILFTDFDLKEKNIGIFLPIKRKKEPNTFLLFSEFSKDAINYFAPKIDKNTDEIDFYSISQLNQIEIGLYQIPEPLPINKIEFSNLDIVLIPLMCFDSHGNRVGYGKGYYDRLLEKAPDKLLKIGVSLFNEIEYIEDVNINDVRLDYCLTPKQLIKFKYEK